MGPSPRDLLNRAQRRGLRRACRVVIAIVLGICAWDDSTDLHWEPRARAIAAARPPVALPDAEPGRPHM